MTDTSKNLIVIVPYLKEITVKAIKKALKNSILFSYVYPRYYGSGL